MSKAFNLLAAIVLLATTAWWWNAGSNKGWTKTSVQIMKVDEITEISYPVSEKRFVPGVDILAAAIVASASLVALGFFSRKLLEKRNPA
jgi:hypothetical protein